VPDNDLELFETPLPVVLSEEDLSKPPELFRRPLPVVVIGEEFPTTGVIDGGGP
jgi:hypothetical protein